MRHRYELSLADETSGAPYLEMHALIDPAALDGAGCLYLPHEERFLTWSLARMPDGKTALSTIGHNGVPVSVVFIYDRELLDIMKKVSQQLSDIIEKSGIINIYLVRDV